MVHSGYTSCGKEMLFIRGQSPRQLQILVWGWDRASRWGPDVSQAGAVQGCVHALERPDVHTGGRATLRLVTGPEWLRALHLPTALRPGPGVESALQKAGSTYGPGCRRPCSSAVLLCGTQSNHVCSWSLLTVSIPALLDAQSPLSVGGHTHTHTLNQHTHSCLTFGCNFKNTSKQDMNNDLS